MTRHDNSLGATVRKFAAGGIACMWCSTVLNPMDVVKVRMVTFRELAALPPAAISPAAISPAASGDPKRYATFTRAFLSVWREEGVRGMARGMVATNVREAIYSSIRMGLYDPIKALVSTPEQRRTGANITLVQKIVAGGLAGALGSAVANPTDLIKIRIQARLPGQPAEFRSMWHGLYMIYRDEGGLRGLYRGTVPTMLRASVLTASQLASCVGLRALAAANMFLPFLFIRRYDHLKHWVLHNDLMADTWRLHITGSLFAGLVTTTTSTPVDVIKTRIMNSKQTGGADQMYKGPMDCLRKTVRHEGAMALMKGWVPNYLRLGPHFIMSFTIYEQLRLFFGLSTL